jgi:hypothetical protein
MIEFVIERTTPVTKQHSKEKELRTYLQLIVASAEVAGVYLIQKLLCSSTESQIIDRFIF